MGQRLRPYTLDMPKCMLPLNGKSILQTNIDNLYSNGIKEINIVVGYKKEKIRIDNAIKFENLDFENNNILFSLMCAESVFKQSIKENCNLIISYSDIIYSNKIVEQLISEREDICIAVDSDWRKQYKGRTEHPATEAEKVHFTDSQYAVKLGKDVEDEIGVQIGEFIGLIKLTPIGARRWLDHFNDLKARISPSDDFRTGVAFKKAYLTNFLEDLIENGTEVKCSIFEGGWMEYDTSQDYEKLLKCYGTYNSN